MDVDLKVLKRVAELSPVNNKHAAGLLFKNQIKSHAINNYIRKDSLYKTIHAEINLLKSLKRQLLHGYNTVDIIVIRINKSSDLRNSRPCSDCIKYLKELGIRKVYYSNSDGNIVYEKVKDMKEYHTSSWNKNIK